MAGLLEKPQTDRPGTGAPAAPPESSGPAPTPSAGERLCAQCAAPLAPGQDWCLECGTAQPGRIGGRPGWRAALTVVALTGVLATGAVAAAYAALSSEARREAAAPAPPPAQPTVTQPPAQTAPAPAEAPAPAPKAETPPAKAPEPAEPPKASTPAPAPASPTPTDGGGTATKPAAGPIDLAPGAATTYDPGNRAAGRTGDPADAIDGNIRTAWEAPVGDDGQVGVGLVVTLKQARRIKALDVAAGTPGFSLEVYASRARQLPPDVLDERWKQIESTRDFGARETIAVGGRYRRVLLWFTEQPADTKVQVTELELRG